MLKLFVHVQSLHVLVRPEFEPHVQGYAAHMSTLKPLNTHGTGGGMPTGSH